MLIAALFEAYAQEDQALAMRSLAGQSYALAWQEQAGRVLTAMVTRQAAAARYELALEQQEQLDTMISLMRQRRAAGLYETRRISEETFARLAFEWTHPAVADWCRRHGRPYPSLGERGEILEPVGDNTQGSVGDFLARGAGARR